ncbi:protein kinase [Sphaerospermopsis aphanizomenoides BCCUSP55]|nr:protein kinase [Sphaerospermopsis aphanizomenoides BCCUSP55]
MNDRYRVIDVLVPKARHQIEKCTLYNAIDITNKKKSKVIKVVHTNNQQTIKRFKTSVEILKNHWFAGIPHIDKGGYFQIEFPNDPIPAHCLVMDKIEGIDLQKLLELQNNKPFSEQQAIDWLRKIVIILGRLHDKNFIHGDIQPSNMMLNSSDGEIVLIDFDAVRPITKAVLDNKTLPSIGTDGYIAPEQRKGRALPQSDFYALGKTFVHLLTGKHPNKLREDKDKKLRWRYSAPQVSKFLADLIDNLIDWSSDNRPKNAAEVLQKLQEVERNIEHQKRIQQWITFNFKKAARFVGFALFGFLVYQTIQSNNSASIQPKAETFVEPTSTQAENYKLCRTTKNGEPSANALANAANDAITFVTNPKNPNRINIDRNRFPVPSQSGCTVIIEVYLQQSENFTSQHEQLILAQMQANINPDAKTLVKPVFRKKNL